MSSHIFSYLAGLVMGMMLTAVVVAQPETGLVVLFVLDTLAGLLLGILIARTNDPVSRENTASSQQGNDDD